MRYLWEVSVFLYCHYHHSTSSTNLGEAFTISEIRRFWPPLRSLETLHDNIRFSQLDRFLERLMKIRTPIPSPPKTPISSNRSKICFLTSFASTHVDCAINPFFINFSQNTHKLIIF